MNIYLLIVSVMAGFALLFMGSYWLAGFFVKPSTTNHKEKDRNA